MHYANNSAPRSYFCGTCQVHGVKLWKPASTFTPTLACAECSLKIQGRKGTVDAEGRLYDGQFGASDQIGYYVPAVPTEDGTGYWGYSSVPDMGCKWWKKLPTRK